VLNNHPIILASKSPRRQFLLKELGIHFEVKTKDVDESFPNSLKAEEIPLYLCQKKATAFIEDIQNNSMIITADTIVWVNNQVLNKPENFKEAEKMLQLLSDNKHEVFTGVCLKSNKKTKAFSVKSEVVFRQLSSSEIESYINKCNPFDKAGSYGAQECLPSGLNTCCMEEIIFLNSINKTELIQLSIQKESDFPFIKTINGSYFNVMGLPIVELYSELNAF